MGGDMSPSLEDDCDECTPAYLGQPSFGSQTAVSIFPFAATFILITVVAYRKVYPVLSEQRHPSFLSSTSKNASPSLPTPATSHRAPTATKTQSLARSVAALTFSSTIALSAVLTELLLCEISNSFSPTARTLALQITVAGLLGLLVIAIPLLGISSVVQKSGYTFRAEQKGRRRLAWLLEAAGYGAFLFAFWAIGALLPKPHDIRETLKSHQSLFQACLDRLGITGVSLMALLSGFASVSAIWQTFGPRPRPVSESDITRKQAGLDATADMLTEKKTRLRHLERTVAEAPAKGFWSRTVGTFRGGNADTQEVRVLEMEVSGLETMLTSLESTLSVLRSRRIDQLRSSTARGRLVLGFQYVFSCYCVYRIAATIVNVIRRALSHGSATNGPGGSGSDTDPVTYAIALFARHIYPTLDQASWAQQISFLLSGVMLLASFSAVTQTFHIFLRFMPSVLQATKTNFALLISQVSGMYVISSALMLRGMMPKEVGSVINIALGTGLLEPSWVQKWFDGFFMFAVIVTGLGIFFGRTLGGSGALADDLTWESDVELGKRS